ncbi:MAG: NAD-dependent epimerase/dehydratase family protein [Paracoccaceae bacterium]
MTDTILVTGISGFIAKHVALKLLNAGYAVCGTVRKLDRGAEVCAALKPHLTDPASLDHLSFVAADLESDAGWADAMNGISAVIHTASPFPLEQPKDESLLIRPAVEGTRRVLMAAKAAGITRIILTSSTVAIIDDGVHGLQDESNWCDITRLGTTAYAKSKTLAEREAWAIAGKEALALTTINPGFVVGPPLDANFGSSIGLIRRFLRGKDPMLPKIGFAMVDVRDVAEAHLQALQRPATAGKRYATVAGSMWMPDMGAVLKAAYPTRRIPTRAAPRFLLRILAMFDPAIRSVLPSLGIRHDVSGARAQADLGITFITPEDGLRASADWLVRNNAV